jgi:hypothetical protein
MAPALLDAALPDLRRVPLADIGDMTAGELENTLSRPVPARQAVTFNSAIA